MLLCIFRSRFGAAIVLLLAVQAAFGTSVYAQGAQLVLNDAQLAERGSRQARLTLTFSQRKFGDSLLNCMRLPPDRCDIIRRRRAAILAASPCKTAILQPGSR